MSAVTSRRAFCTALACLSILTALPAAQSNEGRQVISDPVVQRSEGQRIAAETRSLSPKSSSTNTAVLRIYTTSRKLRAEIPVTIRTTIADDQWHTDYTSGDGLRFRVSRSPNTPSRYAAGRETGQLQPTSNLLVPFAGSDFWLVESTTLKPAAGGYSRVLTWLDQGTLGIVAAEAYDARGKLLKEFQPKSFKKVNGQWQLKEMEIRNEQTDTRTSLVFDVEVQ